MPVPGASSSWVNRRALTSLDMPHLDPPPQDQELIGGIVAPMAQDLAGKRLLTILTALCRALNCQPGDLLSYQNE
ncbi:hypothetical protein Aple_018730 [Acrocarpospora pleiomorpha]|uniref:HTH cro/C1-type domain-containing protein n=1 Tax=Acrocarpospora pleiomorpha TaxID=90975 RepID=A0A5M3XLG2_9ACTN|nr:helix-turn-helix domain-containing protein [Acrocarpospora pleiomorpha]GES18978.1 hypothetical protein Aple_018730 [Acrocarpospora pleiomorpha]